MPIKLKHREAIYSLTELVVEVASLMSGIAFTDLARDATLLRTFGRRHIPRAIRRAERRGLLTVTERKHQPLLIHVTGKGRQLLARRALERAAVNRPKRWDGKWRLVIFDVPEKRRRDRDLLRRTLRQLGFYRLQRSVWLYPYDCCDLVTLVRATYGLEYVTVRYATASQLEEDEHIRRHFDV